MNHTLEIELLVPEDARRDRITVEAHEVFLHSITPPAPQPYDELDLAAADETPAERVLRLLDELQRKEAKP